MLAVGSTVKVKPPFQTSFPDLYIILAVEKAADEQDVYFLTDVEGGFALTHLEETN